MTNTPFKAIPGASFILLFAFACHQEPPPAAPAVQHTPFDRALMLGDVHALANGAAYLTSYHGIFYVNGDLAEKVKGLPPDTFGEMTALADGTALYLLSLSDRPRLFWLRGGTASVVSEGHASARTQPSVSAEGYLFAENQRLKRELEEAALELAATQELQYEEPYYEREPY